MRFATTSKAWDPSATDPPDLNPPDPVFPQLEPNERLHPPTTAVTVRTIGGCPIFHLFWTWEITEAPSPRKLQSPPGAVYGWISLKDGETPGLGTPIEWSTGPAFSAKRRGTMTAMRDNGVTRSFRFLTFSDDPRPGDYDFTASDSDFWRPIPLAGS